MLLVFQNVDKVIEAIRYAIFLCLGDIPVDNVKLAVRKALLPSVGLALSCSPQELLIHNNLQPKLTAGNISSAPKGVQTLLNHLCPLITSQCRPIQITTFKLLEK